MESLLQKWFQQKDSCLSRIEVIMNITNNEGFRIFITLNPGWEIVLNSRLFFILTYNQISRETLMVLPAFLKFVTQIEWAWYYCPSMFRIIRIVKRGMENHWGISKTSCRNQQYHTWLWKLLKMKVHIESTLVNPSDRDINAARNLIL